jgi:CheY-like chemotaxis protein
MGARRALVVDDSRSARAFLTRILERYELAVDGVDSAEQALAYLAQQRPDVIFMDHLMPGMDGFQALQAIKNNPRTATIPIMMYTSQEGELYLSQARALGAIGVLPKQIKHADLSKALDQLKLLGEPKIAQPAASPLPATTAPASVQVAALPTDSAPPIDATQERRAATRPNVPALPPELRSIIEATVGHQARELRRFLGEAFDTHSERVASEIKAALREAQTPAAVEPPVEPPVAPPPERLQRASPWLMAAAILAALACALLWWQQIRTSSLLRAQLISSEQKLAQTEHSLQTLQNAAAALTASTASSTGAPGADDGQTSMVDPVPFGETPLAGARIDHVSQLLSRLVASGFHGVVKIRTIPGRFCMNSGAGGSLLTASDTLPYSKCEQIGSPRDNGSVGEWQSVAFANMIATARASAAGKFDIQISAGGPDEQLAAYPAVSDALTAGEWNRAAAANNRVELHWQASP